MAIKLTETNAPHSHLEIHALIDGGYVVREGRFDNQNSERGDEARWNWRQERAAFATLSDVLKWIAKNMIDKSPVVK